MRVFFFPLALSTGIALFTLSHAISSIPFTGSHHETNLIDWWLIARPLVQYLSSGCSILHRGSRAYPGGRGSGFNTENTVILLWLQEAPMTDEKNGSSFVNVCNTQSLHISCHTGNYSLNTVKL